MKSKFFIYFLLIYLTPNPYPWKKITKIGLNL